MAKTQPHFRTYPHSTQLHRPMSIGPVAQNSHRQPSPPETCGRGVLQASQAGRESEFNSVHVGQLHSVARFGADGFFVPVRTV